MAIGDIIVGIDIGTSKVCTVLGKVNNFNQIEIISTKKSDCKGIKKTKIVDREALSNAIKKTIEEIDNEQGLNIKSAYINVPGKYLQIVQNKAIINVQDKYSGVSMTDVQNAILQVKDVNAPENKTLIDLVPSKFVLKNGKELKDPIGNISETLELEAQLVFADKEFIKETTYVAKKAGIEIDGFVPVVLAERQIVLDNSELEDNILLLDIGAGNIDIGVFEKGKFVYTNTISLGGETITNDIALVLNVSLEEAEKLKRQNGLALRSFIDNDNDITLTTCKGESSTKVIKSSELVEIMEARIEEIFTLINENLINSNIKNQINKVIIVGQGMNNINKSDVLAEKVFSTPCKLSSARLISSVKPVFMLSYAIVKYISSRPYAKTVASSIDSKKEGQLLKSIMGKVRDFFYS